jgi:hypothetical protein
MLVENWGISIGSIGSDMMVRRPLEQLQRSVFLWEKGRKRWEGDVGLRVVGVGREGELGTADA